MERTKGQKGWCRGLGEDWTYSDAACEHKSLHSAHLPSGLSSRQAGWVVMQDF